MNDYAIDLCRLSDAFMYGVCLHVQYASAQNKSASGVYS